MQQKRPPSTAPLLGKMGCVTIGTNPLAGGVQIDEVAYVHANPFDEKSGI